MKKKSLIKSVRLVKLLLLPSRQRVILDSGYDFLHELITGKNKISSPIPPKFINKIFSKLFILKRFCLI